MDVSLFLLIALAVVAGLFVFSRFSRKQYGSLRMNGDVEKAFAKGRLDDGRQYYISGPDACPNAIMGLDRTWDLGDSLWKKQAFTTETMKVLVSSMMEMQAACRGFDILDHRGQRIGVWFSAMDVFTTITILDHNRVSIATPPLQKEASA